MNLFDTKSDTHAIKLLMSDHREVEALFKQFESTQDKARQVQLVSSVCQALAVHAEIEERLFYPASRGVLDAEEQDLVDEAFVEHASLKGLIQRLDGMRPGDALFKAYVTVLKEYVQHHVKEEESDYFPKVQRSSLDLEELGARMATLKKQLMAQTKPGASRGAVVGKLLPSRPMPQRAQAKPPRTPLRRTAAR